jgi:hypothetical protein
MNVEVYNADIQKSESNVLEHSVNNSVHHDNLSTTIYSNNLTASRSKCCMPCICVLNPHVLLF